MMSLIQSLAFQVAEYSPGKPSEAQPTPLETTPARTAFPSIGQIRGPPESPWQASFPASVNPFPSVSGRPAQISSAIRGPLFEKFSQYSSPRIFTPAERSVELVLPPELVVPQPATQQPDPWATGSLGRHAILTFSGSGATARMS